jgi:hypothetical protein
MTLKEFITKYSGKKVDVDNYPIGHEAQCKDLVQKYIVECLDTPLLPKGDAWTLYDRATGYKKIKNTIKAVPQSGDIIIWERSFNPFFWLPYGHIAIFIAGDISRFTSFDQNWPLYSGAHKQVHDYRSVQGWLRPERTLLDRVNEALRECGDDPARSVGTLTLSKWWQNRIARGEIKDYADLLNKIRWHIQNKRYPHDV